MNIDLLKVRARIVREIRQFFDSRHFVEVETAVRIDAPAPEENIDCPPVVTGGFLRASPELQMKKLLAAGMDRIYQIGPCFRDGERGARHNPEFTMIEWYRRNANYQDIRQDMEDLIRTFLPQSVIQTLTVREAYVRYAGWDPWVGEWNQDRFDFDMATKVEMALAEQKGGVFLTDYPPSAASLAIVQGGVAERWEFYWDGMELANCFTELCDAEEQRRRFERAKRARQKLGECDYPIDDEFLTDLPKIKSAAGVALGIDRLIMVLTGLKEISAVRAKL